MTCLGCPQVGVDCDGVELKYTGGVWHDPIIANLDATTTMYTCINNGCPDKGAAEMECKPGYSGPLCALCTNGYFKSVRDCARCERVRIVRIGELVACVLGVLMLITLLLLLARKYDRYIDRTAMFSRECCI